MSSEREGDDWSTRQKLRQREDELLGLFEGLDLKLKKHAEGWGSANQRYSVEVGTVDGDLDDLEKLYYQLTEIW